MTKVIFLDFDGVLNNMKDLDRWADNKVHPDEFLCSQKISILNRIIAATNAKVVVTSAWRCPFVPDHLPMQKVLTKHGFSGDVIGITADDDHSRLTQITNFLDDDSINDFVIIDDLNVFEGVDNIPSFQKLKLKHFFQTDDTIGLTDDIADAIIARLQNG